MNAFKFTYMRDNVMHDHHNYYWVLALVSAMRVLAHSYSLCGHLRVDFKRGQQFRFIRNNITCIAGAATENKHIESNK